jgi:hypothetical protein
MKPGSKMHAERLLALAEQANLSNDRKTQQLIVRASLSGNQSFINAVEQRLSRACLLASVQKYHFEVPSQFTTESINNPEPKIFMGAIRKINMPFFYVLINLCMHVLLLGAAGSGKTNLLYAILAQLLHLDFPILVVDKDKQDYRVLKKLYPKLIILKAETDLVFNSLMPPKGVPPKHWITKWAEVFCGTNGLLIASKSLLLRALHEIFEQVGIFRGTQTFYPTLLDVYRRIKSYNFKGNYRQSQYQDSIVNRLEAYLYQLGETCTYSEGIPTSFFSGNPVVIEVKGISDYIGRFLVTTILFAIMFERIAANERGSILRNVVCIDEAHWFAPPGLSNENIGYSPLASLMAQCREFGMGIIVGSQSAQLEEATFVNSALKICQRLGSGKDMLQVRDAFALPPKQTEYIPKLGTGESIIRIPEEDPFVIQTLKTNFG